MSELITNDALIRRAAEWLGQGKTVAAPMLVKTGLFQYAPVASAEDIRLEGYVRPANSIKEFFFPRHEAIYTYQFKGPRVELGDAPSGKPVDIILGARPCDAAALPVLDHLFAWDYQDTFYQSRREAITVITIACREWDDNCFCTSVGLSPAADRGSDVLLIPMPDQKSYEVRCLTDKGRALFQGATENAAQQAAAVEGPAKKFDPAQLHDTLADFENPIWKTVALRCLGCGACAYTCPTCHCFDIVDEGNANGGIRAKNWDSCQFGMFTLHASGHNPRATQGQRQRQRILHKFRIYPDKFNEILCTGCGNCTRNCPVDLGVLNTVDAINAAAAHTANEVQ